MCDSRSEVATYSGEVRRQREHMVAMQEQQRQLEERWALVPESVRHQIADEREDRRVADPPDHEIVGTITNVREMGDEILVQLDVGDRDGVVQRLPFMVSRGNQFVGMLMIDQVDTAASVGRMTLIHGEVREGDRVYVGPELAARNMVP